MHNGVKICLIKWVFEFRVILPNILRFFLLTRVEFDHAYSILDARQIGARKIVRLRNPWGKKNKDGTSSENDGVFWMRMYLFSKEIKYRFFRLNSLGENDFALQ